MPRVMLTISPTGHGDYLVVCSGEGFTNAPNGAKVGVSIKGDDEWFDDSLFALKLGFRQSVYQGMFTVADYASGSMLNEDWGRDEIYAVAKVDGYSSMKSNTVTGYY